MAKSDAVIKYGIYLVVTFDNRAERDYQLSFKYGDQAKAERESALLLQRFAGQNAVYFACESGRAVMIQAKNVVVAAVSIQHKWINV